MGAYQQANSIAASNWRRTKDTAQEEGHARNDLVGTERISGNHRANQRFRCASINVKRDHGTADKMGKPQSSNQSKALEFVGGAK